MCILEVQKSGRGGCIPDELHGGVEWPACGPRVKLCCSLMLVVFTEKAQACLECSGGWYSAAPLRSCQLCPPSNPNTPQRNAVVAVKIWPSADKHAKALGWASLSQQVHEEHEVAAEVCRI